MTRIRGQVVINQPVSEVFDFLADARNEPSYNARMLRVEMTSPGPIGAGSRFQTELRSWGRTGTMTTEITSYDRPNRFTSVIRSSAMDIDGALTFRAVPAGTLAQWTWDMHARGWMKLIAPLVGHLGGRLERRVWADLKRHLEATQRADVPYGQVHSRTSGMS